VVEALVPGISLSELENVYRQNIDVSYTVKIIIIIIIIIIIKIIIITITIIMIIITE